MVNMTRDSSDKTTPRVLIIVNGGVAEYVADAGTDVCVIDFDNDPDAVVPDKFFDLLK